MKLNINEWKEFNIARTDTQPGLFEIEDCKCSCANELEDGEECDKINYIGAKKNDNGVMRSVKIYQDLISKGNGILFICDGEGSVGYTNYMADDFIGSTTTSVGYDNELNPIRAMFLVTILDKERFKYSFGRKYKKNLQKAKISLPIQYNDDKTPKIDKEKKYSEDGYVPDWEFMENYIKSLKSKPLTTKNKVSNKTLTLNINEWKEFNIARTDTQPGLFEIEDCKCSCANELEDGEECDKINYIGAKKNDNGVMRSVKIYQDLISKGNGILFICDGEGSVGYTNYMADDFIGSTTTSVGYDNELNPIRAMFLVTILDKERFKYSFGRKYKKNLQKAKISLPIQYNDDKTPKIDKEKKYSEDGYVPDWEFMENYIKQLPYSDKLV